MGAVGPHEALLFLRTEYYMGPTNVLCGRRHTLDGPMWANCLNITCMLIEFYLGPCNSFVQQSSMSLMGQYKPIVQMLCACGGPMQGLAHPTNILICGPTQLSHMAVCHVLDGPMQANCSNITFMQWAHVRACAWFLTG
jgi:hypothetical protein